MKTRYAICGLSLRGVYHFLLPILGKNHPGGPNFNKNSELVAILDIDRKRVKEFCRKAEVDVPFYLPKDFHAMIRDQKPDVILVVSQDYSHCEYTVKGLLAGCDVIVEKPMVISQDQIRKVIAAEKKSGKRVRVAFNMRYTPTHQKLKRMIQSGILGEITNVEFTYNLDTFHGASYFYRWNRSRAKSGGLCIHKCTHHFDFINWVLDDDPVEVYAHGALNYYGPKGALRPMKNGKPLSSTEEKRNCPYFKKHYAEKIDPENNPNTGWDLYELSSDVQYPPNKKRYIYDKEVDIEDTYSALVKYRRGTSMSYSCNFSTPWEGYLLGINGTKGRIEIAHHSHPDPTGNTETADEKNEIVFYPLFGGKQVVVIPAVAGAHGGADFQIQQDLFGKPSRASKELALVAGSRAGGYAVAIGEAVWRSAKSGKPIRIQKLK